MTRFVARALLIVVIALVLAELCLQVASLFAPHRAGAWRAKATRRILCVGDSHTWGTQVARESAYPGHLQRLLDERAPGMYSVINLGLPGMNSAQVRTRLPLWLSRYQPDVLIVWVGINNLWNTADVEEDTSPSYPWLEHLALRSRLWRLLRVMLHDRNLERYRVEQDSDRVYTITDGPRVGNPDDKPITVRHDGIVEQIRHRKLHAPESAQIERTEAQAARDYAAIHDLARAAGVALVFVTYPMEFHPGFVAVNRAIRRMAASGDVAVVEGRAAVARIPEDERVWLWAAHPSGPMYEEIARDLVPVVVDAKH